MGPLMFRSGAGGTVLEQHSLVGCMCFVVLAVLRLHLSQNSSPEAVVMGGIAQRSGMKKQSSGARIA